MTRYLFFVVAFLAPSAAAAQSDDPVLTGIVTDSAGAPIGGAEVFLGRSSRPVTTNDQGVFRVSPAPRGRLWVAVRRIGYAPVRRSITLVKGERQHLQLAMAPLPVTLPELKVVERSGMKLKRLNDFFRRSRTGYGGRFITRDDIERRNPYALSAMIRPYLPWAALTYSEYRGRYWPEFRSAAFGRFGAQRCPPAISMNGGLALTGWYVDEIPVSEVEAVEVYRPRWSEIPIEFTGGLTGRQAVDCGLVVVWQRSS